MIIGMELMDSKSDEAQEIPLEWMTEKYNALVKEAAQPQLSTQTTLHKEL